MNSLRSEEKCQICLTKSQHLFVCTTIVTSLGPRIYQGIYMNT